MSPAPAATTAPSPFHPEPDHELLRPAFEEFFCFHPSGKGWPSARNPDSGEYLQKEVEAAWRGWFSGILYANLVRNPPKVYITRYFPPNGDSEVSQIINARLFDLWFFHLHRAELSAETLTTGQEVLYAKLPISMDDSEEEVELLYIIPKGEASLDALTALRVDCEEVVSIWRKHNPQGRSVQ